LPAVPDLLLDGKEGVDGSSPSEALQRPRKTGSFVFATTCPSPARSGVEAFWKNGSFGFRPSEASWERAVKSTNARAGQFNARMTWSQSSMCSLSISRTLGIRSALRFS
jgi:hypothetical protein